MKEHTWKYIHKHAHMKVDTKNSTNGSTHMKVETNKCTYLKVLTKVHTWKYTQKEHTWKYTKKCTHIKNAHIQVHPKMRTWTFTDMILWHIYP